MKKSNSSLAIQTGAESRAKDTKRRQRSAATSALDRNGRRPGPKPEKPKKGPIREWTDALIFALVVMLVVRTFVFDLYRIPTPSMEKTLLVGDYLFVSKLNYGTRTPMTLGIPFTQLYVKGIHLPWTRLPGFSEIQRGDAVVFNYPRDDKPIDRKTNYIKRIVGLPGETLQVKDKTVYVNGEALPLKPTMQQFYNVYKKDRMYRLSETRLAELGVTNVMATQDPNLLRMVATPGAAKEIASWPWIARVEPYIAPEEAGYGPLMYPSDREYTPDNYGPVTIPKQGVTVTLTDENWPVYGTVIEDYEHHTVRRLDGGKYEIDGEVRNQYTFEQDYYFAMGDNRDNSEDSRFWGFVPFDHVVGKAILVYFSWGDDGPRFGRFFHMIH